MTSQKFREQMNVRPFRPYTICLADGREISVVHPDFVAAAPNGREAMVYSATGECHHVDILLVTCIRVQGQPEGAGAVEG
jgi:hypothetical protein